MAPPGKSHRQKKSVKKAATKKKSDKKLRKDKPKDRANASPEEIEAARARNPKAFSFQSAGAAHGQRARTAEKEQRRLHGEVEAGWLTGRQARRQAGWLTGRHA